MKPKLKVKKKVVKRGQAKSKKPVRTAKNGVLIKIAQEVA